MFKRIIHLLSSYAGILLLFICWMLTLLSLINLISLEETENHIRTILLPNKVLRPIGNHEIKAENVLKEYIIYMDQLKRKSIGDIVKYKYYASGTINVTVDVSLSSDIVIKVPTSINQPHFITTYETSNISNAPGENGKPYHIDKTKLSPNEKLEYERGWNLHQFNLFASDRISIRRTIPDRRSLKCKNFQYNNTMSSTSIIIVFHNEAWSTLLRTVHSIIDRSQPEFIKEIILVDDASTFDDLGDRLEDYMKLIKKVKIKRTKIRLGLMKARIIGAEESSGDILTFLDAHIECYPGWLEPLLSRIADNETNVVCPVIDSIGDETFEPSILNENYLAVGVFDWTMQFNWKFPSQLNRNLSDLNLPIRSPAMAGGLFSIKRNYFYHLGTYDPGMKIWGSENIEMSFRIWMCGGTLEIIPCSHVGHIFRSRSPYNWGESIDKILVVNQRRLVDVWLGEYKDIYYEFTGNRNRYETGNISARLALKEKLKCRSFQWYLKNVYPELYDPLQSQFIGFIQSLNSHDSCLDYQNKGSLSPVLYQCHFKGGNQLWIISNEGFIRNIEKCFISPSFILGSCEHVKNDGWMYDRDNFLIRDTKSNCVTISNQTIYVKKCSLERPDINQKWNFKMSNIKLSHL